MSLLPKRAHGAVVVVEDGKPLGIVTERDGAEIDRFAQVREVMTSDVLTFDAGVDPRTAFNEMSARHIDMAPVLDGGQLVGALTRKGALRSTIYDPAVDADGKLVIGAAVGINGDVRGKAEALLDDRASTCSSSTPHTATSRRCSRRCRSSWPPAMRTPPAPAVGSRSPPATWCRPTAYAIWSRPAPTSSRSASGPARCARPG